MAITVKKNLVPSSKYSVKAPYKMKAQYITFHNTANDATAENEISYMLSNNNQVSYHFAVDENSVVQGVPVNRNAWHCGDGGSGTGNRKSIGVEVCYSKSGGTKYKKAEALAIKFVAQLLHERGWGVDRVKRHQEWSGKYCPHRVLSDGRWGQVKTAIQKELTALNGGKSTSKSKPAPSVTKGYLAKGDKGTAVKKLQDMLIQAGYSLGKYGADKIFGASTETAVKKLQKDNGISVDGLAGNSTMQVLESLTSTKTKGKYKVKKGDTLSEIALDHGMSLSQLKNANGLKSDVIQVGQKLNVSKKAKKTKSKKTTSKKGNMKTKSVVTYLDSINENSSFANRKKLAKKHGIKNYEGTASQNTKLLKKLRGNKSTTKKKATTKKKSTSKTKNGIKTIGKVKIVKVNKSAIIMSSPDRNNAKNIGTISKGSKISIAGSVKGKNNANGYWEVIYKGKRAYISAQYGKRI